MSSSSSLKWTAVTAKKPPKNVVLAPTASSKRLSPSELQAEENSREQRQMNCDVVIFGSEKLNFDAKVAGKKELRDKKGEKFTIVTFASRSEKEKFLLATRGSFAAKVTDRLTKFNARAQKELRSLRAARLIGDFRRAECNFEAKIDAATPWLAVTCDSVLARLSRDAKAAAKATAEDEKSQHKEQQLRLHKRLVIAGLPLRPPVSSAAILEKFAGIFGIKFDDFAGFFSYEDKARKIREIHVDFREKSVQSTVLRMAAKRPIFVSDLSVSKPPETQNFRLSVEQALTDFNGEVERKLAQALVCKKIAKFELHDQRFRFKTSHNSRWTVIGCRHDMQLIL